MPLGSVAVVMANAAATVMANGAVAVRPAESVTCTVKLNGPAAVGVPVRLPAALSVRPVVAAPAEMDQVYGEVPPVAANACV